MQGGIDVCRREACLLSSGRSLPRRLALPLPEDRAVVGAAKPVSNGNSVNTPEYVAPRNESGAREWVLHPRQLTTCPV